MAEPTWVAVSCEVADVIRHSGHVAPSSSRTDMGGAYGPPLVYTEWSSTLHRSEPPVLREWRHPPLIPGDRDRKPCEHQVPVPTTSEETR